MVVEHSCYVYIVVSLSGWLRDCPFESRTFAVEDPQSVRQTESEQMNG